MTKSPKGWQAVKAVRPWTERLAYHNRKMFRAVTKDDASKAMLEQPAILQATPKRITKS